MIEYGTPDCWLPIVQGALFRTEYECCLEGYPSEGPFGFPGCRGHSETVGSSWYPMPLSPSYIAHFGGDNCVCCGYCEQHCVGVDCDMWGNAAGCMLIGAHTCECAGEGGPAMNVCNPEHIDPVQCHCNADVGNGVPAGT